MDINCFSLALFKWCCQEHSGPHLLVYTVPMIVRCISSSNFFFFKEVVKNEEWPYGKEETSEVKAESHGRRSLGLEV